VKDRRGEIVRERVKKMGEIRQRGERGRKSERRV